MDSSVLGNPSTRAQEITDAAWTILNHEGPDALTMRRLAAALGIKASSLYKHFPDKQAVEVVLIERGFRLWGETARAAHARPGNPVANLAAAYRRNAREWPHLYRLMTMGELPRDQITPGLEDWSGAPLGEPFVDPQLARAFWGLLHGLAILEIDGRFPANADLDRTWLAGIDAFSIAAKRQNL